MSQQDYEDQPEAPDLGSVTQEPVADSLAGPPDSDVLDAGYVPPDRQYVADDVSALSRSEDLDDRLRAERPDINSDGPAGQPSGADRESDRAPRLTAAQPTPDTWYTENLAASDVGLDGGAASVEEAAMHVHDEDDAARPGENVEELDH